jgi:hypothetical protein
MFNGPENVASQESMSQESMEVANEHDKAKHAVFSSVTNGTLVFFNKSKLTHLF